MILVGPAGGGGGEGWDGESPPQETNNNGHTTTAKDRRSMGSTPGRETLDLTPLSFKPQAIAALRPAIRAARVDPAQSLRAE